MHIVRRATLVAAAALLVLAQATALAGTPSPASDPSAPIPRASAGAAPTPAMPTPAMSAPPCEGASASPAPTASGSAVAEASPAVAVTAPPYVFPPPVGLVTSGPVAATGMVLRRWPDAALTKAQIIVAIVNQGCTPAAVRFLGSDYTLRDPTGADVGSGGFLYSLPAILAPGERGYLLGLPGRLPEGDLSVRAEIVSEATDRVPPAVTLGHRRVGRMPRTHGIWVRVGVRNGTGAELPVVTVGAVLHDRLGEVLGIVLIVGTYLTEGAFPVLYGRPDDPPIRRRAVAGARFYVARALD